MGGKRHDLDCILKLEFGELLRLYTGPGDVIIESRDGFYPVSIGLEISGKKNQVLNSEDVGDGLANLFRNGEFLFRYAETVKKIAAIYARGRSTLKERGAARKG
jgi:hypothetical protein